MDTEKSVLLSFLFIAIGSLLGLLAYETSMPERMAREGFIPYQMPGKDTVYWYKSQGPRLPPLSGF